MKNADELFVMLVFALIGGLCGFLVYAIGLGGWEYVFIGRSSSVFQGAFGWVLCVGVGGIAGWYSYRHRHHEVGGVEPFAKDAAGGFLLSKRVMVIIGGMVAAYFIWRLLWSVR